MILDLGVVSLSPVLGGNILKEGRKEGNEGREGRKEETNLLARKLTQVH